jgi:hypothetical protein
MFRKQFKIETNENGELVCPQCKEPYLHFPRITLDLKEIKDAKIDHNGNIEINTEKTGSGEKYRINLHYRCEQGHEGVITLFHCEGFVLVEHKSTS